MSLSSDIPRVYGPGNRGKGADRVRRTCVVRGCLYPYHAENLYSYRRITHRVGHFSTQIVMRRSTQCCFEYRNGVGLGCRSSRIGTLSLTRAKSRQGCSRAVSEDVSSYDEISEQRNEGRVRSMLSLAECQQMLPLHAGNVYLNVPDKVTCAADLVACLDTDTERGISKSSGWSPEERMEMYGSNALEPPKSPSFLELVLDALNEFTVLVLLGAGGASMVLELWLAGKEHRDANLIESVSILAAVAVVVLVSAVNNWQKDKQFKALQEVQSKENVRAVRNGREMSLPAEDVVVGDLLVVETGDILCADGVLIQGYDVKVDESHLTGESDEVEKNACVAQAMYSGSKVLTGVGRMIVTSVGSQSQSGMIADMVVGNEEKSLAVFGSASVAVKEETLLQKKLANYASVIGKLGLGASVLTTAIMAAKFSYEQFVVQGVPWSYDYLERYLDFFITGVTILVVAIPEGLPLAVTISLAFSVMKMLEDNNLVRHLSAAETMGTATVICTDKTGTLTQNKMAVKKFWMGGDIIMLPGPQSVASEDSTDLSDIEGLFSYMARDVRNLVCEGIALNSTASIKQGKEKGAKPNGNKTELALLELAEKMGGGLKCSLNQKKCQSDTYDAFVIGQCPFTSERKRMSSVVLLQPFDENEPSKLRLFVKGAAEVVLRNCSKWVNFDGSISDVTDQGKEDILDQVHGDGLRLLCLAYKDLDIQLSEEDMALCNYSNSPKVLFNNDDIQEMEKDLTIIAVAGISDPLRPEVVGAIKNCKKGGISVRMFTGDNPITAESIAVSCGILEQEHGPLAAMESKDFIQRILNSDDQVDGEKFVSNWEEMRVLARCSPTDKYTIVEALKKYTDEIVAVTGDGTNDAPALRSANVGFAMNDGTQIAKQAADIILVDNNFASTVSAALWGRNVYANISRFLQFQLTVNLVAVVTAAGGAITAAESPLTAVQMLWVNLIMDSLASLALATGTPDPSLLDEKPYSKDYNFVDLNGPLPKHILGQAAFQLAIMAWLLGPGPDLLGIPRHEVGMGPSLHHTMVFNTFVMMQLFNQVNARQIKDSNSILSNLGNAHLFKWVLGGELILQGLIVQFGGPVFATVPLDSAQWATCIGFGASSLLLRELLRNVNTNV